MADDQGVVVQIENDPDNTIRVNHQADSIETDQPEGGVVVQLNAGVNSRDDGENKFYQNLAERIDSVKLSQIANDLYDAISKDDESRKQSLDIRAKGLKLLGLKLEEPQSTVADSSAGVEGLSTVRNPVLLDAMLRGWANARAELLPAEGPAKIEIDDEGPAAEEDLADRLEQDFNHYLTQVATEYYPETSHMLLWGTYFGGSGFKKVYRCPMRERPVAESVPVEDLIVSDAAKDFRSCERITHQSEMRQSVMKRMKFLGVYRDASLTQPTPEHNTVDTTVANIQGVKAERDRPQDQPYTIWECQCELDLDEYAPKQYKGKGIPLPYRVTMDKDSREILALYRDWHEDDEQATRKRLYVKYPYIPGPGFYGTGMLGLLGNLANELTTVDRESLDAGKYASFPAGLIQKLAGRQNTSDFRLAPGEFIPVETNNLPLNQVVMPLPYKDVTAGLMAMRDKVLAQAKEISGSAEIPGAEGLANIPVGTMLAQIEQATKVTAAAHKDMYVAQCDEFDLMLDLFRENPEDFWRSNKIAPDNYWNAEKLLAALENHKLVPRADPNTPSHVHRLAKGLAIAQLFQNPAFLPYLNPKEALERIMRVLREDPTNLVIDPPPQQGGADPTQMVAAQAKMKMADAAQMKAQVQAAQVQTKASSDKDDAAIKAAQLASEQQIENTRLAREQVIHAHDVQKDAHDAQMAQHEHALNTAVAGHEAQMAHAAHGLAVQQHQDQHALGVAQAAQQGEQADREHDLSTYQALNPPKPAKKE